MHGCTLFALIFSQSLNRVQRGLSAIAELLVRSAICLRACLSVLQIITATHRNLACTHMLMNSDNASAYAVVRAKPRYLQSMGERFSATWGSETREPIGLKLGMTEWLIMSSTRLHMPKSPLQVGVGVKLPHRVHFKFFYFLDSVYRAVHTTWLDAQWTTKHVLVVGLSIFLFNRVSFRLKGQPPPIYTPKTAFGDTSSLYLWIAFSRISWQPISLGNVTRISSKSSIT